MAPILDVMLLIIRLVHLDATDLVDVVDVIGLQSRKDLLGGKKRKNLCEGTKNLLTCFEKLAFVFVAILLLRRSLGSSSPFVE